jgi:DNA-binding response OmpR family regulator
LQRGALSIDVAAMRAQVGARALALTPTELAVLVALARSPGVVHPRQELLASIWSSSHEGYLRNVDCHVARLRRKLEAAGCAGNVIETVHGVGYRWRQGS